MRNFNGMLYLQKMTQDLSNEKCGTYAGWNVHRKRNEACCQECREAKLEYDRAYRSNPDKIARIQERDRLRVRDSEERKRTNANYRLVHKNEVQERSRTHSRKRRALKLENGFEAYTEAEILALYGSSCHICSLEIDMDAPRSTHVSGWEQGLHIDHVVPITRGGSDTLDNVKPAHGKCNVSKNNRLLEVTRAI